MHDASDGNIKCCVLFCFLSPPSCLIAKRGAQRNGISVVDISFRWSRESNWREQRHAVFLQRYISWIQPLVEFEPAEHVQDQLCHNHQQSWFVVQDDGCWDPHREFRGGQRQQEPNVILENISVSRYNLIINQNYPLIFLSFCRFSQLCSNFLHPERRHPHLQLWRDDRPVRQPEARLPKPFSCIDGVWGGGVRRLVNCSPKVSKCVSQQKMMYRITLIKSVTQSHFFQSWSFLRPLSARWWWVGTSQWWRRSCAGRTPFFIAETSTGTCWAYAASRSRGRWKRRWKKSPSPSPITFGLDGAGKKMS